MRSRVCTADARALLNLRPNISLPPGFLYPERGPVREKNHSLWHCRSFDLVTLSLSLSRSLLSLSRLTLNELSPPVWVCISPFFGTEGIEIVIVSLLLEIEKADVIRKFRASLLILLLYFVVYIDRGGEILFRKILLMKRLGEYRNFRFGINGRAWVSIRRRKESCR